jgi:surface antigen
MDFSKQMIAAFASLIAVGGSPALYAQTLSSTQIALLEPDDMRIADGPLTRLLTGAANGSAVWSNPRTGARGRMVLTGDYRNAGLRCRRVQHHVEVVTYQNPVQLSLGYCWSAREQTWKADP